MTETITISSLTDSDLLETSIKSSEMRRTNFIEAIPPELSKREDQIQIKLSKENASARNKLHKIYRLMNDLGHVAKPYVACSQGCSSCCRMNVTISQIEANLIAEKTGLKVKQLTNSIDHHSSDFIGIPCKFLKNDSCTIYEMRPFVCRKHIWFDTSSYWCSPERSLEVTMPMIEFSGAVAAFFEVTRKSCGGIHADIRDFFP